MTSQMILWILNFVIVGVQRFGSTYKMLQLVAVFEDAEGNEVW